MDFEFDWLSLSSDSAEEFKKVQKNTKSADEIARFELDPELPDVARLKELLSRKENVQLQAALHSLPTIVGSLANGTDVQKVAFKDIHAVVCNALPGSHLSVVTDAAHAYRLLFQYFPRACFDVALPFVIQMVNSRTPEIAQEWTLSLCAGIAHSCASFPAALITDHVLPLALARSSMSETTNSRVTAAVLFGSMSMWLHVSSIKLQMLDRAFSLCQDTDFDVRLAMAHQLRHFGEPFATATRTGSAGSSFGIGVSAFGPVASSSSSSSNSNALTTRISRELDELLIDEERDIRREAFLSYCSVYPSLADLRRPARQRLLQLVNPAQVDCVMRMSCGHRPIFCGLCSRLSLFPSGGPPPDPTPPPPPRAASASGASSRTSTPPDRSGQTSSGQPAMFAFTGCCSRDPWDDNAFGLFCQNVMQDIQDESDVKSVIEFFQLACASSDIDIRLSCAINFKRLLRAVGARKFAMHFNSHYASLCSDPSSEVRAAMANDFYDVALCLGRERSLQYLKDSFFSLLNDPEPELVTQKLFSRLPEAIAMFNVSNEEARSKVMRDVLSAVIHCEANSRVKHNWRFRCGLLYGLCGCFVDTTASVSGTSSSAGLPTSASSATSTLSVPASLAVVEIPLLRLFAPDMLQDKLLPVLYRNLQQAVRPLRLASAHLFALLYRWGIREPAKRWELMDRICGVDFARNRSCTNREAFLDIVEAFSRIFSSRFVRERFIEMLLQVSKDPLFAVRYRFVKMIPLIKSIVRPPTNVEIVARFNERVSFLMMDKDNEIAQAAKKNHAVMSEQDERFLREYKSNREDSRLEEDEREFYMAEVEYDRKRKRLNIRPTPSGPSTTPNSISSSSSQVSSTGSLSSGTAGLNKDAGRLSAGSSNIGTSFSSSAGTQLSTSGLSSSSAGLPAGSTVSTAGIHGTRRKSPISGASSLTGKPSASYTKVSGSTPSSSSATPLHTGTRSGSLVNGSSVGSSAQQPPLLPVVERRRTSISAFPGAQNVHGAPSSLPSMGSSSSLKSRKT